MNTTGTGAATGRIDEEETAATAAPTAPAETSTGTAAAAVNGAAAASGNGTGTTGTPETGERGSVTSASWALTAEPRSASRARDLTARTLRAWRVTDPADIGEVVLMVDELVTNAVVHGTGPIRLTLRLDGRRLHAEVADADPSAPARPAEPPVLDWAEAGRGLLLVAALAAEHGTRPGPAGKTVWFTRRLNAG